MKKIFIASLFILLVILIGIIWRMNNSQAVKVGNSEKTYVNKLGYSFQYPSTWSILECLEGIQVFIYADLSKMEDCESPRGNTSDVAIVGPTDNVPGNIQGAEKSVVNFGVHIADVYKVKVGQDAEYGYTTNIAILSFDNSRKLIFNYMKENEDIKKILSSLVITK